MVKSQTSRIIVEVSFGILSLFIGGMIYLAFRDESLVMFGWFNSMGLHEAIQSMRSYTLSIPIPNFVKYCLPDGLWTISYILLVDALVERHKIIWALSLPLIAIFLEILQGFSIIKGIFDWGDVLCYSIPVLIFVIIKIFHYEKCS